MYLLRHTAITASGRRTLATPTPSRLPLPTLPLHISHSLSSAPSSICVEGREERVLECRVLGRLLEVAVHISGGREDALDASGRGRRGKVPCKVLLDHLGQGGPLALLLLPSLEHVNFEVGLLRLVEVLV